MTRKIKVYRTGNRFEVPSPWYVQLPHEYRTVREGLQTHHRFATWEHATAFVRAIIDLAANDLAYKVWNQHGPTVYNGTLFACLREAEGASRRTNSTYRVMRGQQFVARFDNGEQPLLMVAS